MAEYTIIVPDSEILQRVCGTNDSNLKLIEAALGVPVFAVGNQLSLECDDCHVQERLKFVIDRFSDEAGASASFTDAELLESILNTDSFHKKNNDKAEHDFLSSMAISVPGGLRKVYPRTRGQAQLVKNFRKFDMVFAEGPAGCGKTFLCMAEALRLLLSHEKKSIVLTRPVVEAGESLGYLPGDLQEKINPYIRPLYDAMNLLLPKEMVRKMTESGVVEIAPLAYMRGRTLNDSVIILDEAQNTSQEQMKMFLTRMGENSKVFVTGDLSQIDLPCRTPSGLEHALKILSAVSGISITKLEACDVVRNPLVKEIIQAYDNGASKNCNF